MNKTSRIILLKLGINILGILSFLSMFAYTIITLSSLLNIYTRNISTIFILFIISMIFFYLYISSINIILNKYNIIDNLEKYRDYTEDMKDMINTLGKGNILTVVVIGFFIISIITNGILLWCKIDDIKEFIIGYFILVIISTINLTLIAKYAIKFKYFDKRLHGEVYK